ncbi:MAG: hypothetical protein AVO34_13500 [Firmicutes bacterium ML8_F2]|jgi:exodeoxyribonuclease V alpha subunit|nr:MAG: hypothetical protein AVO34_13500 [Firmicutes bacterium ML8_F2]
MLKGVETVAAKIDWTPMSLAALLTGRDKKITGAAIGVVSDLPCSLLDRIGELNLDSGDLFFAWEIASLAGRDLGFEKQRALLLLILAVQAMSVEGSTRLPLAESGHFNRILKDLQADDAEKAVIRVILGEAEKACDNPSDSGLAGIFGKPDHYRPLIFDHGCLYMQKLHAMEGRVGKLLKARITSVTMIGAIKPAVDEPEAVTLEEALREVFATPPTVGFVQAGLDEQQKLAICKALSGRITVISGRPGSGKTSIVASILRVLARTGRSLLQSVALAAPTGKAADRLRQSVTGQLAALEGAAEADLWLIDNCPPSTTLHRLLGYSPRRDRFWHNERNPLAEKLVIVDESSMVDLAMMDQILRALQPEARLILLGDADQLPSIESGAVLRDLCRSNVATKEKQRVVVLEKSYRAREEDSAGKRILEVAAVINEGRFPGEAGSGSALATRRGVSEILFEGVEHLMPGDEYQRAAFLTRWYELLNSRLTDLNERLSVTYRSGPAGFDPENTAKLKEVLDHFEQFRILCATRMPAGGAGSEEVNAWFFRRWLEHLKKEGLVNGSPHYLLGEPVLMTRNDYSLRLYNGDSGLVLNVVVESVARQRPAEPMAVFPRSGSFVAYPIEALRGRLDPAWATTVHKAQGSEYENVAIILPTVHVRPLTRELLYTAITRAKKSVVIVGPQEILNQGLKHSLERASGLADMLG